MDGDIQEIIVNEGSSGGCVNAMSEAIARITSVATRSGVPIEDIVKQIEQIKCDEVCWDLAEEGSKPDKITSCPQAISVAIKRFMVRNKLGNIPKVGLTTNKCKCGNFLYQVIQRWYLYSKYLP